MYKWLRKGTDRQRHVALAHLHNYSGTQNTKEITTLCHVEFDFSLCNMPDSNRKRTRTHNIVFPMSMLGEHSCRLLQGRTRFCSPPNVKTWNGIHARPLWISFWQVHSNTSHNIQFLLQIHEKIDPAAYGCAISARFCWRGISVFPPPCCTISTFAWKHSETSTFKQMSSDSDKQHCDSIWLLKIRPVDDLLLFITGQNGIALGMPRAPKNRVAETITERKIHSWLNKHWPCRTETQLESYYLLRHYFAKHFVKVTDTNEAALLRGMFRLRQRGTYSCSLSTFSNFFVAAFHTNRAPSEEPAATYCPSGLNMARDQSDPTWKPSALSSEYSS